MELPKIGYGTYLLKENIKECIKYALDIGYRHIDTANAYKNEEEIGQAIIDHSINRQNLYITSKLWPGNNEWNQKVKTYDEVITAGKNTLKALKTDYIDLYLIHAPFAANVSKEHLINQWKAMLKLKELKIARNVGVSNFSIKHLNILKEANLELPKYNQIELHPLCQQVDLLHYMQINNILPIAYSSLLLLKNWRLNGKSGKTEIDKKVLDVIENIAIKHNISQAQVLLQWALYKGYPILPKSDKFAHIKDNFVTNQIICLHKDDIKSFRYVTTNTR